MKYVFVIRENTMSKAIDIILKETGFKNIAALKKELLKNKEFQYGCYYSEIKKPSFKVSYTSNPNCFASFLVSMNGIGMTKQMALDQKSLTKAGIKRGCSEYYLK